MDYYEVIKKLIGPIEPVGETNADDTRYKNLEYTIALVDRLMVDIGEVAPYFERPEFSMSRAGKKAKKYFADLRDTLNEEVE
jgi:hypothetical protein